MSTIMGGPGWWLASDGRWYPPETHPATTSSEHKRPLERHGPPRSPLTGPATELLEMTAPGPIPPAFYGSAGDAGTLQAEPTLTIEHATARYMGGFLPEPESQNSSFVRCTSAGVQFRDVAGCGRGCLGLHLGLDRRGADQVNRRFAANLGLSAVTGASLIAARDASDLVVGSGGKRDHLRGNGMMVAELHQAIEPLLGRLSPAGSVYATAGPAHDAGPAEWSPAPANNNLWPAPSAPPTVGLFQCSAHRPSHRARVGATVVPAVTLIDRMVVGEPRHPEHDHLATSCPCAGAVGGAARRALRDLQRTKRMVVQRHSLAAHVMARAPRGARDPPAEYDRRDQAIGTPRTPRHHKGPRGTPCSSS